MTGLSQVDYRFPEGIHMYAILLFLLHFELFASNNVKSITCKFQNAQYLTLDVQQFEHK